MNTLNAETRTTVFSLSELKVLYRSRAWALEHTKDKDYGCASAIQSFGRALEFNKVIKFLNSKNCTNISNFNYVLKFTYKNKQYKYAISTKKWWVRGNTWYRSYGIEDVFNRFIDNPIYKHRRNL